MKYVLQINEIKTEPNFLTTTDAYEELRQSFFVYLTNGIRDLRHGGRKRKANEQANSLKYKHVGRFMQN